MAGVSGIYDFGPLGVELRNNIRRYLVVVDGAVAR